MSCKSVKNKRPEVCWQVRSLGFLHVQDECDVTYCGTGLHIVLQALRGEGEVKSYSWFTGLRMKVVRGWQ